MRFITYLATLLFATFLSACGGGGGSSGLPSVTKTPITTSAAAAIRVAIGESQSFVITGGTAPYQITSNNVKVAVASIDRSTFTITGIAAGVVTQGAAADGTATITITDSSQQSAAIAVTVPAPTKLFSTAPATMQILNGATNFYTVYGGVPPYVVNTNGVIARTFLNGSSLAITGVVVGHQTVAISDAAGASLTIDVTVNTGMFTDAPLSLSVANGASTSYAIYGGIPYNGAALYRVNSSNPAVASASVSGSTLSISGLSIGSTTLVISDSTNASISVAVTVPQAGAILSSAPSSLTLAIGESQNYALYGGDPASYVVKSSSPTYVTASVSGSTLTIRAEPNTVGGSASVEVTDAKNSPKLTINVTAAKVTFFTTAPDALAIAAGAPKTFAVIGGSAPYSVVNTHPAVVQGSVSGATLVITGISGGTGTVIVSDSKGETKSIAVTVAAAGVLTTTAPATATLALGSLVTYDIIGGVPDYKSSSSNPAVVKATVIGSQIRIEVLGVSAAPVTITITDSAGKQASFAVSIATLTVSATSPVTLTLGSSAIYDISGGVPAYKSNSSNPTVASATIIGSQIRVDALSGGTSTLTITDSAGKQVSFVITVPGSAMFIDAPTTFTVAIGGSYTVTVSGGSKPYSAFSDTMSVATVSTPGADGKLTITGVSAGSAVVTIKDMNATGTPITLSVKVVSPAVLFTTAPATMQILSGTTHFYTIYGGTPKYVTNTQNCDVASNCIVARATISGSSLSITGLVPGHQTIVISDAVGAQTSIDVTVNGGLFSDAPPSLAIGRGTGATYTIYGGVPYAATFSYRYRVNSSNPAVADATISGSTLSISGISSGSTSLVISDSVGASITVTVTVPVAGALMSTGPSALTLAGGTSSVPYAISGGVPFTGQLYNYTAVSSNPGLVSGTFSGSSLSITAAATTTGGSATIVVSDSNQTQLTPITVTVTPTSVVPVTALFVNAPGTVNIGAGTTSTSPYLVGGGAGGYVVSSSDSRVATGFVNSSSILVINALTVGTATLSITDAVGAAPKTVTVVVDNTGGTGPSAVNSLEILASSNSLNSAPGSLITFIVTAKDSNNNAMPGQTIAFSATSGILIGATPAPVTTAAGTVATVSLSPGADASIRDISVKVTSGTKEGSIKIPVVGTTLTVAGAGSALAGTSALTYSIKALDSGGKPVVGAALTVISTKGNTIAPASVTTDVSGTATFKFTPFVQGTDTITVNGLGTKATTSIEVSNEDFAFTLPTATDKWLVNTSNNITVCYKVGGSVVAPTSTVTFSTTRGTLGASVYPDAQGCTSTTVTSQTAGPVTISAQMGTVRSSVTSAFIATIPATIVLQANPGSVLPNATGSTTNQSTLSATVRDINNNPVSGQVVNFTATKDGSNGSIVPGSGTTDANGMTSVQFIPGALSTAANGVQIQATVQGASSVPVASATLTVNGNALFISIGIASDLVPLDSVTYKKQFSVYVTDANGAPAANRAVTISVFPPTYGKGFLVWDVIATTWKYSSTSPTLCANEDLNRDGILNSGEDVNGNGKLDPGLPVVISPSTVTTDATGNATFFMNFGKNYAWWLSTQVTARASVGGTESLYTANYSLEMLAADATSKNTPPNQTSPFGIATDCKNMN